MAVAAPPRLSEPSLGAESAGSGGAEPDARIALTSVGSLSDAEALARALLADRLCACVSLVPQVRSLYFWQGVLHDDAEVLLVIKTTRSRIAPLAQAVQRLHPYETPEWIVLHPDQVGEAYGRWLAAEAQPRAKPDAPGNPL